jgi:P pilus assembly chaperone PapD
MKITRLFTLFLAFLICFAQAAEAKIDLLPRKVLIEGRDRAGEITIMNTGEAENTFRIEFINFQQAENGVYKELPGPLNPTFDPEKAVRLSPRQFTLPPGGRQKIRFSIRPPANLPQGEYRFHLKAVEQGPPPERDPNVKGPHVHMKMNIGISIPVIFRNGELSASAKISDITIVSAEKTEKKMYPEMRMKIERKGTASTVGLLNIYWSPKGGETSRIGQITNMNLFTDINYRNVAVPLTALPSGPGTLKVSYTNDAGKGKGQVFDEVILEK